MASKRPRSTQARGRGRASNAAPSRWLWGLGGLTAGLLVALAVQLYHTSAQQRGDDLTTLLSDDGAASAGSAKAKPAASSDKPDKPRFEFYKLLPEQEVAVSEPGAEQSEANVAPKSPETPNKTASAEPTDTTSARAAGNTPSPTPQKTPNGSYLLQAGSFKDFADADRLKATLALLGVESRVREVELSGGQTWYRLRIGPFESRSAVNAVRKRLAENEVETILLRSGG